MKLGYARVSTTDQDLTIQRGRLYEAGCEKLFWFLSALDRHVMHALPPPASGFLEALERAGFEIAWHQSPEHFHPSRPSGAWRMEPSRPLVCRTFARRWT